ncbi:DUF3079 domain-containing protein [Polynucleobacter sp. 39-46-10]
MLKIYVKSQNSGGVCWEYQKYCPRNSIACKKGSDSVRHPHE